MANLVVSPSVGLADQPLTIVSTGLLPRAKYTLVARMLMESVTCQSHAHYVADVDGMIDVGTMTSLGGSYFGIEPMGLVWFLEPQVADGSDAELKRRFKYQMRSYSVCHIEFFVYADHVTPKPDQEGYLTKVKIERLTEHPGVCRFDISNVNGGGKLKGTLFVPSEGNKTFLGILDLAGWVPGVVYERRASLLAARGYVTLALGYAECGKGTPELHNIQLEYFLEAIEFLHSHPQVSKRGIAIVSDCLGSYIGLHLAAISDKVKAIVTTNCGTVTPVGTVTFGRRTLSRSPIMPGDELRLQQRIYVGHGLVAGFSRRTFPVVDSLVFPMHTIPDDVHVLMLAGADDQIITADHSRALARRLQQAGRSNFKVVINPGQGHDLLPPYLPAVTGACEFNGKMFNLGGQKHAHERAMVTLWSETVDFLQQCNYRLNV